MVFALQVLDDFVHGKYLLDSSHALAGAPDVAPWLAARGAEVGACTAGLVQLVGIQARRNNTGPEVVARDAGKVRGIDDIAGARLYQHVFIGVYRAGFAAGNEARADVGEVGAHGPGSQYVAAARYGARQGDRPVVHAPNFGHEGKGAKCAGMAASPRTHQYQPVHASLQ